MICSNSPPTAWQRRAQVRRRSYQQVAHGHDPLRRKGPGPLPLKRHEARFGVGASEVVKAEKASSEAG